jgi:phage portal protein BeeE
MKARLPRELEQLIQCTTHTIQQIAEMTGVDLQLLEDAYETSYSCGYRVGRELRCIRHVESRKLRHGSRYVRADGYVRVLRPDWFTGAKSGNYVSEHQVVMCEALGLTGIPKGMVVHHIDQNRANNSVANLQLMTNSAHTELHQALRKVTNLDVQPR